MILVPVHRPGELISAKCFFFLRFSRFFLFPAYSTSFLYREKRFCSLPTCHNYGHPLDRKQTFFKVDLLVPPAPAPGSVGYIDWGWQPGTLPNHSSWRCQVFSTRKSKGIQLLLRFFLVFSCVFFSIGIVHL